MSSGNGMDLSAAIDTLEGEMRRVEQKIDGENAKVLAELRELRALVSDSFSALAGEMVRLTNAVLNKDDV